MQREPGRAGRNTKHRRETHSPLATGRDRTLTGCGKGIQRGKMPGGGWVNVICRHTTTRSDTPPMERHQLTGTMYLHSAATQQDRRRQTCNYPPTAGTDVDIPQTAPRTIDLPTSMDTPLASHSAWCRFCSAALGTRCASPHVCQLPCSLLPQFTGIATGDGAPRLFPASHTLHGPSKSISRKNVLGTHKTNAGRRIQHNRLTNDCESCQS